MGWCVVFTLASVRPLIVWQCQKPIITALEAVFPQPGIRLDAAELPNPFFGVSNATFPDSNQELLALVDGGEDGETTPFQPLLVKARGVDTIIAIDAVSPSYWYAIYS